MQKQKETIVDEVYPTHLKSWAGEMVQWVKVIAVKHDNLSSIPELTAEPRFFRLPTWSEVQWLSRDPPSLQHWTKRSPFSWAEHRLVFCLSGVQTVTVGLSILCHEANPLIPYNVCPSYWLCTSIED